MKAINLNQYRNLAGISDLGLPAILLIAHQFPSKTKSGPQAALGYDVLPGGEAYAVASLACSSPRLSMA